MYDLCVLWSRNREIVYSRMGEKLFYEAFLRSSLYLNQYAHVFVNSTKKRGTKRNKAKFKIDCMYFILLCVSTESK